MQAICSPHLNVVGRRVSRAESFGPACLACWIGDQIDRKSWRFVTTSLQNFRCRPLSFTFHHDPMHIMCWSGKPVQADLPSVSPGAIDHMMSGNAASLRATVAEPCPSYLPSSSKHLMMAYSKTRRPRSLHSHGFKISKPRPITTSHTVLQHSSIKCYDSVASMSLRYISLCHLGKERIHEIYEIIILIRLQIASQYPSTAAHEPS